MKYVQATGEASTLWREHPAIQNYALLHFFLFCGPFCTPGDGSESAFPMWIQIQIQPIQFNTDTVDPDLEHWAGVLISTGMCDVVGASIHVGYTTEYRVYQYSVPFFFSVVRIGSPNTSTARECCSSLPLSLMGKTHSLAGERGGGPNSDEGTDTLVQYSVYTIIPLRCTIPVHDTQTSQLTKNERLVLYGSLFFDSLWMCHIFLLSVSF